MLLQVQLLHKKAKLPNRSHQYDAGLDLFSVEDVLLEPHQQVIVPTGIAIAIPTGYAGFIWPRSGLSAKNGVDVLAGVVDSGYRGEIKVVLQSNQKLELPAGSRIAQLVIQPVCHAYPTEVELLDQTSERQTGGFGSTGI